MSDEKPSQAPEAAAVEPVAAPEAAEPVLFAPAPPAAPSPWRPGDLALFVAFVVVGWLLSQFLTLAAYALLRPIMGWHAPAAAAVASPFLALAAQCLYYGFVIAYFYVLVVAHYRLPFWSGLGWKRLGAHRTLQCFLAGVLLALGSLYVLARWPDKNPFPLERLFESPGTAVVVALFAVTVAPLMEELVFRGALFAFLETAGGLTFATLATAVLFAAFHVPEYWGAWNHLLMIALAGSVFSLGRAITKSVLASFILHVTYNAAGLAIALYAAARHFHQVQALVGR